MAVAVASLGELSCVPVPGACAAGENNGKLQARTSKPVSNTNKSLWDLILTPCQLSYPSSRDDAIGIKAHVLRMKFLLFLNLQHGFPIIPI